MLSVMRVLAVIGLLQVSATWGQTFSQLDTSNKTIQQDIVNKHNDLRRSVTPTASNMLEMSWNSQAEANAQAWANNCSEVHSAPSQRTVGGIQCGENLFMSSSPYSWDYAIQDWYNEYQYYRYGYGPTGSEMVGHYTQVVWYRSNEIGCGVAHCPQSTYAYFYVCQYCPAGNVAVDGQSPYAYPYKEGPTCGDCPNACDNGLCTNPCPYSDKYSNCGQLVGSYGCSNQDVASWCPASCKCQGLII